MTGIELPGQLAGVQEAAPPSGSGAAPRRDRGAAPPKQNAKLHLKLHVRPCSLERRSSRSSEGCSCSSVYSEEFKPEALVDSGVAHRRDNSEVKTGLEETHRGYFENLLMKDSETFDEFYAKLSDIVNSSFNLGEKISESKIVGKILRSLPDRFQPKVTAIEEAQDVDNLKLDQLVGNLQTYEAYKNFKKKQKDVAFSSAHRAIEDSDEDCEIDSTITDAFVKQFKFFFLKKNPNLLESTHTHKSKGKDKLKINSIAKKDKGKIQGNFERVQCYECQGFGHFAQECPTRLRKKKALVITWDDELESDKDESDNEDQAKRDINNSLLSWWLPKLKDEQSIRRARLRMSLMMNPREVMMKSLSKLMKICIKNLLTYPN
ncbi:hypothetical protein CsSME_00041397 [Camellia sinensis var. sinensis]